MERECARLAAGTNLNVGVCRCAGQINAVPEDRYGIRVNVPVHAKRKSHVPNGSAGTKTLASAVSTKSVLPGKRSAPDHNGLPPSANA